MAAIYMFVRIARPLCSNSSVRGRKAYLAIASFFLTTLLALSASPAWAKNLYVDVAGVHGKCSDSVAYSGNDQAHPWCTMQKAAYSVNTGDVVTVADGTYTDTNNDGYIVELMRGGTAGNEITFKSENKWGAVLDGQNTATHGIVIGSYGGSAKSYVRVEEFEIKNLRYMGITVPDSFAGTNFTFHGNKIHDIGRYQVTDPNCTDGDATVGRTAIFVGDSASYITVDSNLIYNIGRIPGGTCTQYDYTHDHGLYFTASHVTIINNIFYGCAAGWPVLNGFGDYFDVVNNTFYGANPQQNGHIIVQGNNKHSFNIKNNISYGAKNSFVFFYPSNGRAVNINNNLIYNGSLKTCDDNSGGATCTTLTYNQSNNIIGQDPEFLNLANKDFHLQSSSPAINRGASVDAPKYDFDGNLRPYGSACDIGAYEYCATRIEDGGAHGRK